MSNWDFHLITKRLMDKKKRIFVVEDESIVSLEIQDRLKDLGYEVAGTAASGEKAIELIGKSRPDLVLMDIMLKGEIDGIQTAELVKLDNHIPLIFLTAYADNDTLNRAKVTDPYGYIIKPFEERELHIAIEMALYKHESELKLREKDQWMSTVLKSIGDAVIATDSSGIVKFMNNIAEELTGFKSDDAEGQKLDEVFNIVNESTGEPVEHPVNKVLEMGSIVGLANHTALISKNGDILPIMDSAAPITDDQGNITGVVLVFQDMSERKRTESILIESEKRFKNFVENSPEIIYQISKDFKIEYISPRVTSILGYSQYDFKSHLSLWVDSIHPADIEQYKNLVITYKDNETSFIEYRIKDSAGNWKWIKDRINIVENYKGEKVFQGFAQNISDKKLAEEKITLQQSALNSAYNGIIITDRTGTIVWCNEAITRMSEYEYEELIGSNPRIFKSDKHTKEFYNKLWSTVLNNQVWSGELINRKKSGLEYYEEVTITPVKNIDGRVTHFVSIKQDITERKNFENQLITAKEQAERSDRLKSEFLAQISHEIRTPINSILSFTNLLKTELKDKVDDDIKISFDMIDQGSKRLIRTIDLVLNMSAIQTNTYQLDIKPTNIAERIIKPIMFEFEGTAQVKGLKLIYEDNLNSDLEINIDEYSVSQIFVNLIDNALKYTREGYVGIKLDKSNDNVCKVIIEDSGIGISEEYLPHLFDPFSQEDQGYTRRYEGNGLGLALVKNYCTLNNAEIRVESKKDVGSKFIVEFKK